MVKCQGRYCRNEGDLRLFGKDICRECYLIYCDMTEEMDRIESETLREIEKRKITMEG